MSHLIRVKFVSTSENRSLWERQFPRSLPVWGQCSFHFNHDEKEYDWLVVYNDFPRDPSFFEELRCPPEHSLLITTEPSSITAYGTHFVSQFGHVLTSQPEWALSHKNRIFSQPALHWFYGWGNKENMPFDYISSNPPLDKSRAISTVCSSKRQRHTLHNKRYKFTQQLKLRIPDLDIFGHGVRPMDDKAEALDPYKYHIAIENFIGDHHWTEKLSDSFLGVTLPFYCGAPNAFDYFPEESFIPIDLNDPEGVSEIIRKTIRDNEFDKRLPHILEARRRVLEEYNLFAVLSREIEPRHGNGSKFTPSKNILFSRRMLRKGHPVISLTHFYEKCRSRILHAVKGL